MARDVDLEGQLRVLGMECCQAGRRRVGVQRERGVAMYCGLFGRTLDRSKHMVLADVPVRSLTASHEVRLDSQRNRTCINPVSHLRGRLLARLGDRPLPVQQVLLPPLGGLLTVL